MLTLQKLLIALSLCIGCITPTLSQIAAQGLCIRQPYGQFFALRDSLAQLSQGWINLHKKFDKEWYLSATIQ